MIFSKKKKDSDSTQPLINVIEVVQKQQLNRLIRLEKEAKVLNVRSDGSR